MDNEKQSRDNGTEQDKRNESGAAECAANIDQGQDKSAPVPIPSNGSSYSRDPNSIEAMLFDDSPKSSFSGSPNFKSLQDVMRVADGIAKMDIVHQIAIDHDYKIEVMNIRKKADRTQDCKRVAYWETLRAELAHDPPIYNQALKLLADVKVGLNNVLLPQHQRIRQEIEEVLDAKLISQQMDAGTIDFEHYADYVVVLMSKLCAPCRDDKIEEIRQCTDIVEKFEGIEQMLIDMELDMANFTLQAARPRIIAHSVEFERKKFAQYLKLSTDGLRNTEQWLLRELKDEDRVSCGNMDDRPLRISRVTTNVLNDAYIALLESDFVHTEFPETLAMDFHRLDELTRDVHKLSITSAILLLSATSTQVLQSNSAFKDEAKKQLCTLLQDVVSARGDKFHEELKKTIEGVALQMIKLINEKLNEIQLPSLSAQAENFLQEQIVDVARPEHKIRQLFYTRIRDYLRQLITTPTADVQKVPAGLTPFQSELTKTANLFVKVVSHNRAVHGQIYIDIINKSIPY